MGNSFSWHNHQFDNISMILVAVEVQLEFEVQIEGPCSVSVEFEFEGRGGRALWSYIGKFEYGRTHSILGMYYNWLAIGYDNSANKNNWWAIGGKDLLAITTFWL